jgi:integration host factor subunit alpha
MWKCGLIFPTFTDYGIKDLIPVNPTKQPLETKLVSKTLNKAAIAGAIYEGTDCTRPEAKKIADTLLATMKAAIKRDHALLISGFGKFEAYAKKARRGRNPATNEAMILGSRKVVVFRLSKKLRQAMNKDL